MALCLAAQNAARTAPQRGRRCLRPRGRPAGLRCAASAQPPHAQPFDAAPGVSPPAPPAGQHEAAASALVARSAATNLASTASLLDALAGPEAAPAAAERFEESQARFDWRRHWYAVAALAELDASLPTAVTVLGERIAVWRDASGTWRAFRDVCPHRMAPLSEGRLAADGTLQARPRGRAVDVGAPRWNKGGVH